MATASDKRKNMEEMLARLNFTNYSRFEGIKGTNMTAHDSAAAEGCAASHLHLMENNTPPFIILEDDATEKNFRPIIEFPDDADAVYLGNSSWGRLDGRSGPFVHLQKINENLLRIFNMLSTHAMLFISQDYVDMCARVAEHWMKIANHLDIGYAEIHRYFNIYAFDKPPFYQSSSLGTDEPLSSYPHVEVNKEPTLTTAYGINKDQGHYLIQSIYQPTPQPPTPDSSWRL